MVGEISNAMRSALIDKNAGREIRYLFPALCDPHFVAIRDAFTATLKIVLRFPRRLCRSSAGAVFAMPACTISGGNGVPAISAITATSSTIRRRSI